MKITGWRTLTTWHHWERPIGDVNGTIESGVTEVPILMLETDEGITGIGLAGMLTSNVSSRRLKVKIPVR